MPDDRREKGSADRRRVAGNEGYEVNYFATEHGISRDQARKLISKIGNHREKLNKATEKL